MSKRHNSSRRRNYGRRQHELHERMDRRHDRRADRAVRTTSDGMLEALPYLDSSAGDSHNAFAD
jgi:hypothetical protein